MLQRYIEVVDRIPFDAWQLLFNTVSDDIKHKIFVYRSVCKAWNQYINQSKEKIESSTFRQFGMYLRDRNNEEKVVLLSQWALFLSKLSVNTKMISMGNSNDKNTDNRYHYHDLRPLKMVLCNIIIEKNLFTNIIIFKVHDVDDPIINRILPSLALLEWLELTKCAVSNEGLNQCRTTTLTHLGLIQCTDLTKSMFCESKWTRSLMSLSLKCHNNEELLEGAIMNSCLENLITLRVGYVFTNVNGDDTNAEADDEYGDYYIIPSLTSFTLLKTLILDDPRMAFFGDTSISSLTTLRTLCLNVISDDNLNDSITLLTNLQMLIVNDECIDCKNHDDYDIPTIFYMLRDLTTLNSFMIHFRNTNVSIITILEALYMDNAQFHYTIDEYTYRSVIHVKRIKTC
jgi:hypothetical protein